MSYVRIYIYILCCGNISYSKIIGIDYNLRSYQIRRVERNTRACIKAEIRVWNTWQMYVIPSASLGRLLRKSSYLRSKSACDADPITLHTLVLGRHCILLLVNYTKQSIIHTLVLCQFQKTDTQNSFKTRDKTVSQVTCNFIKCSMFFRSKNQIYQKLKKVETLILVYVSNYVIHGRACDQTLSTDEQSAFIESSDANLKSAWLTGLQSWNYSKMSY